ncbi:MAG: hypothetical protein DRJ03_10880 [Chloroflexi bacterium]|nr:MAG: hypothetical protein DRJ03_10880 [Chloroflexota bacterium]
MDVHLRIKALEDRMGDLENPKAINFAVDNKTVLTITPDKHFVVNGKKCTDLRTIVTFFGNFAKAILDEEAGEKKKKKKIPLCAVPSNNDPGQSN